MKRTRLYLSDELLNEAWEELQDAVERDPPTDAVQAALDRVEAVLAARDIKLLGEMDETENPAS